jgi:Holliday junction resolvasome RuvABC endonuclease subunit
MLVNVGIDQSFAKTGIVMLSEGELVRHLILPRVVARNRHEEAVLLAKSMSFEMREWDIGRVAIEGIPFMSRSNVTRDLAGLQYLFYRELYRLIGDERILIVPPTELKKFATGSGKASKEEMIASVTCPDMRRVMASIGKTKGRDDLADAWHLARYAEEKL